MDHQRIDWSRGSLVAAAAWLCCAGGCTEAAGAVEPADAVESATATATATTTTTTTAPSWQSGTLYRYDVVLATTAQLGQGQNRVFDFTLRAQWELAPLPATAAGVPVSATMRDPKFTQAQAQPGSSFETVSRDLGRPYAFTLKDGLVTEARIATGATLQAAIILRTLSAALQLAPASGAGAVWKAEEHDATGRYQAEYRSAGAEVSKRKLGYDRLLSTGHMPAATLSGVMPRVLESASMFTLRDGAIASAKLDERVQSELSPGQALTVSTRLELRLVARERLAGLPNVAELDAATEAIAANAPYGAAPSEDRFDALKIGELELSDVLSALERNERERRKRTGAKAEPAAAADAAGKAAENRALRADLESFSALVALLRQDPGAAAEVSAEIDRGSPIRHTLLNALANAGTADTQRILVALVTNAETSAALRRDAATSLIRVKRPNGAMIDALRGLVNDPVLAEHAVFGLGTAARNLREAGDEQRADAIGTLLVEQLRAAADDSARIRVLRGISNSADLRALPSVEPFLKVEQASVRRAAVDALLLMHDGAADALLADRMLHDDDVGVRLATIRAAGERPSSAVLVSALSSVAVEASQAALRHKAVDVMTRWLPRHPELRAPLKQVVARETKAQTRELAVAALATPAQ